MTSPVTIEGTVFEAGDSLNDAGGQTDAYNRAVSPTLLEDDLVLDRSLRPKMLGDYIGQTKVKESLATSASGTFHVFLPETVVTSEALLVMFMPSIDLA